jgi:hypothetical protein
MGHTIQIDIFQLPISDGDLLLEPKNIAPDVFAHEPGVATELVDDETRYCWRPVLGAFVKWRWGRFRGCDGGRRR